MKQLIISVLVSLTVLYLIVAFIGLTPNVVEWGNGGRAAYLLFGMMFGVVGHLIHSDIKTDNDKLTRF